MKKLQKEKGKGGLYTQHGLREKSKENLSFFTKILKENLSLFKNISKENLSLFTKM
jgi:hypothetical protein